MDSHSKLQKASSVLADRGVTEAVQYFIGQYREPVDGDLKLTHESNDYGFSGTAMSMNVTHRGRTFLFEVNQGVRTDGLFNLSENGKTLLTVDVVGSEHRWSVVIDEVTLRAATLDDWMLVVADLPEAHRSGLEAAEKKATDDDFASRAAAVDLGPYGD